MTVKKQKKKAFLILLKFNISFLFDKYLINNKLDSIICCGGKFHENSYSFFIIDFTDFIVAS